MKEHPIFNREEFDAQAYLNCYDDVRNALERGAIDSAWSHYNNHGRTEGRRAFRRDSALLDEGFYTHAYPIVQQEIAAGIANDPAAHYDLLGRGRGFLAAPNALRPDNAAGMPSAFGGLWPDARNGADLIEGKLETGLISEQQAEKLRFWRHNGYVILEQAIAPDIIDAAAAELDKAYAGGFRRALFECHKVKAGNTKWDPAVLEHAAKVLDLHHFSIPMREIMFAPAIEEFLGLIFESKAFATQSLGFLRGSGQEGHQDSAYVPFTMPRSFAATWIALEDVTIGAGELFYYVGSHLFPDFLYGGRYKSIAEAERNGYTVERDEIQQHVSSLVNRAQEAGMTKQLFAAKKGDVLVWHADLVHGGNPVSKAITRKSFVTHYCPKRLSPVFSERSDIDLHSFRGHLMTSHLYNLQEFIAG
ncbi:MAG: phytanoyl-CoA dioxygenase family protein [Pseudomonadota bacterium]